VSIEVTWGHLRNEKFGLRLDGVGKLGRRAITGALDCPAAAPGQDALGSRHRSALVAGSPLDALPIARREKGSGYPALPASSVSHQ